MEAAPRHLAPCLLQKLPDVERIAAKLQRKSASLGDIVQVVRFAQLLPSIISLLKSYDGKHAGMLQAQFIEPFEELGDHFGKLIQMAEEVRTSHCAA